MVLISSGTLDGLDLGTANRIVQHVPIRFYNVGSTEYHKAKKEIRK